MRTFRKNLDNSSSPKKTHLTHLFLKDVFSYLDPKCVKFVPKFTKKQLPKGINTYLEDPGITTCPFFPPCFGVPFSGSFLPPTTSTLTFLLRSDDEGTDPKLKNFSSWSFVALDLWPKPVENGGWNRGW